MQNDLAVCYENGLGVEENLTKVFQWYQKSGEAGDSTGQNNLTVCYENGLGVEKNLTKASYWYQKSFGDGDSNAL